MVRMAMVSVLKIRLAMLLVNPRIVPNDAEAMLGSLEVMSWSRSDRLYFRSRSPKNPLSF
jgi:hypothetical protein